MRKRLWRGAAALVVAVMSLGLPGLGAQALAAPATPVDPLHAGPCAAFPETGKTVTALFLDYWQSHGGLTQQGYPIEDMAWEQSTVDGKPYIVQYFERAVFEWHPENPTPNNVLLSLLGTFRYHELYPNGAPGQVPNTSAGAVLFPQTGKRAGGAFLSYWQGHGGLAQQGYPISDEFDERSPVDGKVYRVQYFERAVFEFHPENPPPYNVLLSRLGVLRDQARYPQGWPPANRVPAQCTTTGAPGSAPAPRPPATTPAPAPTQPAAGPDRDGDGIPDAVDKCPDQPETRNGVFDGDGCPDTIQDLINFAVSDIDGYWQQVFATSNLAYQDVRGLVPYNTRIKTPCGTAPPKNAFFCGADLKIYYDQSLLQDQLQTDGDFAPVTILAHEWGHLIQANLGISRADYPSISIELQADCYAGAYARHANDAGLLEAGDLNEAATSLFNAGDAQNTPWFAPEAHGQPQQRVDSFNTGYQQGPAGCNIK